MIFCRYFSDRYGVENVNGPSQTFSRVSDLKYSYPFIYKYLQSYSAFQNPAVSSGQLAKGNTLSPTKRLIVIAHRGAPVDDTPENSMEAFLLAKKHDADGIEFDVSQTKDKQNIVMHGP